jgi:hypothetical protein
MVVGVGCRDADGQGQSGAVGQGVDFRTGFAAIHRIWSGQQAPYWPGHWRRRQLRDYGVFHVLAEHWDGHSWTVSNAVDPNGGGNNFYAIKAVSANSVYAVGQTGTGFPSQALVEHWDGHTWSPLNSPADPIDSLTTLGVTGNDSALTLIGDRENSTSPYTTEVATGAPNSLSLVNSPNNGTGENDLFATTTAADGSTYAVGWYINASGTYQTLILHGVNGQWSIDTSPNVSTGDNGFAGVAQVPGGGQWAVGVSSGSGNFSTLIAYRC